MKGTVANKFSCVWSGLGYALTVLGPFSYVCPTSCLSLKYALARRQLNWNGGAR